MRKGEVRGKVVLSNGRLSEPCRKPNKNRMFTAFGYLQKKARQGIVSYSRELLVRLPLPK
jgi:hypothetical protein